MPGHHHRLSRAQLREVGGLSVGQQGVHVHRPRVHPEWAGRDIGVLHALCMHQKHPRRAVAHQHSLAKAHHCAGVNADPVSHAKGSHPGDLCRLQGHLLGLVHHRLDHTLHNGGVLVVYHHPGNPNLQHSKGHGELVLVPHHSPDLVRLGDQVL